MYKLAFNDGLTLKTVENGVVKTYESKFYLNYVEAAKKAEKNSEWKTKGEGARFMGVTENRSEVSENGMISYFKYFTFTPFPSREKAYISISICSVIFFRLSLGNGRSDFFLDFFCDFGVCCKIIFRLIPALRYFLAVIREPRTALF